MGTSERAKLGPPAFLKDRLLYALHAAVGGWSAGLDPPLTKGSLSRADDPAQLAGSSRNKALADLPSCHHHPGLVQPGAKNLGLGSTAGGLPPTGPGVQSTQIVWRDPLGSVRVL